MKKILISLLSMFFVVGAMSGCNFFELVDTSSDDSGANSSVTTESSSDETEEYCTITFKQIGQEDIVKRVEKGATLTDVPACAEKTGYTVTWERSDFSNITENIVVNAKEVANEYTVKYDCGSGALPEGVAASQVVKYDRTVTHPTPVLEGWEFVAWTYEGAAVSEKWTIADSVTLTAEWLDVRAEYTVKFMQEGKADVEIKVKAGESVAEADIPTIDQIPGYDAAWDRDNFDNIQGDVTVKVVYTAEIYTFEYQAEGYSVNGTTVSVTYNARCSELAVLEQTGFIFLGWAYGGKTYTNETVWTTPLEETTETRYLTPEWAEKDKIVITFVDTDGSTEIKIYEGESLTNIPTPSAKTGYEVDTVWYADEACQTLASFENIQTAMKVYAKATPKKYTVALDANGGTVDVASIEVTYDAAYELPTPANALNYMQFVCWKDENGATVDSVGTWTKDNGASLIAEWKDTRVWYTVSFVQAGQETKTYTGILAGTDVDSIPEPVAKTGYKVEWDAAALAKLNNISENVVVNAVETVKTYTIVLNPNGGKVEGETTITVTYGEAYELPTPTRTDYTFKGWKYKNNVIDISGIWALDVDEEIQLTASWKDESWTNNY